MLQRHSERESRREVGTIRRRRQQRAVENMVASVGALNRRFCGAYIASQKRKCSCGKLRHFYRVKRHVKRISNVGFPVGCRLGLKGVPNNGVPILEIAISGENGNTLARPIVGKWIV